MTEATLSHASPIKLNGLSHQLVADQVLSQEKAIEAQQSAREKDTPLINFLIDHQIASPAQIAHAGSVEYGFPLFDLAVFERDQIPIEYVEEEMVKKYHAVPLFKRGDVLFVAISDPMNLMALEEFKYKSGLSIEPLLVEEDKLAALLETAMEEAHTAWEELTMEQDLLDNLEVSPDETQAMEDSGIDEAPVVRFVNKMLLDGIRRGASDIHLEVYEKQFRVRFRMDGMLHEIAAPPRNLANKITARIKVMSRMDIAERRIPQDGRIKLQVSKKRAIDFRVNTCPVLHGEKIVLRILDPSSAKLGIEALGYSDAQKKLYLDSLSKPYGMILVTGPTGSGKTVSLYTGLNILNTPDRNISTAEDPAEINMPGVNQVNVNPKAGLDFASALRAFLRQDPDIIMVGEIRDLETAEIAIKAAQTGHLVLSTLHTNDAPQTLTRLANMGVPPYNIASAVSLIIAQRLGRKLCDSCKEVDDIPKEALLEEGFKEDEIENLTIYRQVGCDKCTGGYKGRVGIFQVMPVSEKMGRIIMEGGNAIQLADQAQKENIADLRQSGLDKVRQGVISLDEVNRVTKD